MNADAPVYARMRATLAGGITGIVLPTIVALPLIGIAAATPHMVKQGMTPALVALSATPGVVMIAAIYALPVSALLVWLMTAGAQKAKLFDNIIVWISSGCVVSFPAAWVSGQFESRSDSFQFNYGSLFIFAVAASSASAAWLFRKRSVS